MSSQDLLLGNNYIIQWLALQLCNNLTNNQPVNSNQTNILANTIFNNNDNSNLLAALSNNESHLLNKEKPKTNNIIPNKLVPNGCRFNPMRSQSTQSISATPKLKSSCPINNSSPMITTNSSSSNPYYPIQQHPKQTLPPNNLVSIKELQPFLNNNNTNTNNANDTTNNIANLSPSSLANLISLTSNGQLQFLQPRPYQQSANINDAPNLLARLTSPVSPSTPYNSNNTGAVNNGQDHSFDLTSSSLLESLYSMNDEPTDDAINLIAQRTNSTGSEVSQWFQCKREAERNNYNSHPPNVPSSTLLAKLNAVTSRPDAHILAEKLDQKMVALLEAFYAINDNPEPAAIEMIAKRINTTVEAIGDWFDVKRIETNPNAGPRSPPVKKREGGRVVTFSEYQRSLLEAIFDENNYLHPQEYEELSNLIQVPSRNIKIWFKNRRSKQRLSGRTTTTPGSANNSD